MDIWVLVQLSPDSSISRLPDDDLRLLKAMNGTERSGIATNRVFVSYVDRSFKESFAQLVYDKFRILQMTQYRRVMFLDADTIPLTNMDYMFSLSEGEEPLLQPNFIMASGAEPCNAGMFILEPKEGEWEALQQVIHHQHASAKDLPYPGFDNYDGKFCVGTS